MRVLLFVLVLFAFGPALSADEIYICPMHPHIEGEAGETCPICGMTLVPKVLDTTEMSEMDMAPVSAKTDVVTISPKFIQALGVKTTTVKQHVFGRQVRAFGEIVPSTRTEVVVNMRVPGWVKNLATSAVGDTVEEGALLFTYYSPEIMSAQSDYLIAKRSGASIDNLERRLRLYGMDDKAIAVFKARGEMMEETPFHAPVAGTIVSLNVRAGSYVKTGDQVLALQNFNEVWVNADVPVRDMQFLREGQKASVRIAETGQTYESQIDFIHHVADPRSRTAIVRLVLPHNHGEPKPGTFVDVRFEGEPKLRLAVPSEAILYGGAGAKVIASLGDGQFKPVAVEVGVTAGGMTEILTGLSAGQEVVRSGQFMIDAESNLRGGMSSMGAMDMDNDAPPMEGEADHVH